MAEANRRPESSRRAFLKDAGLVGTAAAMSPAGLARGANDRIGVGFIGCGNRGSAHMRMVRYLRDKGKQPVALVGFCDVYRPRREEHAKEHGGKTYEHHRDLLEDPNVDVVCIATPDHHHCFQAIDALEAGKGVYVEKPLSHWRQFDVLTRLTRTVAETGKPLQVGAQAMSDSAWEQMRKLVQEEGIIGQPVFGETGYFRVGDWGERGMPVPDREARPGKDLNWELFQKHTTNHEFSVDRFFRWRLFLDYAGGPVTDLYPHCLTPVAHILGVGRPDTVVATGGIHRYDTELREVPDTLNLLAEYDEKVTISVLGTQANDYNTAAGQRGAGHRIPVIRGWEGTLTISSDNKHIDYIPVHGVKRRRRRFPIDHGEDPPRMWENLIRCFREGRQDTWADAELGSHVQTALLMGMWSHHHGKVVRFDAGKEEVLLG